MMITFATIKAVVAVDMQVADRPGALDAIGSELVKQVIWEGENHGTMIREESVRLTVGEVDESRFTRAYVGYWYPNPRSGCLLMGGPFDGEVIKINEDVAPQRWHMPYAPEPALMVRDEPFPYLVSPYVSYSLKGMDTEKDCWVYEYQR